MNSEADYEDKDCLDDDVLYYIFEAAQTLSDDRNDQDYLKLMLVNRAFARAGEQYFCRKTYSVILDDTETFYVLSGYDKNGNRNYSLYSLTIDGFLKILELLLSFSVPVREIDLSNFPPVCVEPRILELLSGFTKVQHLIMYPRCNCEGTCPLMKPNLEAVEYMTGPSFYSFKGFQMQEVSIYIRSMQCGVQSCKSAMEARLQQRVAEIDVLPELLVDIGRVDTLILLDANTCHIPFNFARDLIRLMQVKRLKLVPSYDEDYGWDFAFATEVGCIARGPLVLWAPATEKISLESLFFNPVTKLLTHENFIDNMTKLNNWFTCSECITIEYSGIENYEVFKEKILSFRPVFNKEFGSRKASLHLYIQKPEPAFQDNQQVEPVQITEELPSLIRTEFILYGYHNVVINKLNNDRAFEAIIRGYDKEITLVITIFGRFNEVQP